MGWETNSRALFHPWPPSTSSCLPPKEPGKWRVCFYGNRNKTPLKRQRWQFIYSVKRMCCYNIQLLWAAFWGFLKALAQVRLTQVSSKAVRQTEQGEHPRNGDFKVSLKSIPRGNNISKWRWIRQAQRDDESPLLQSVSCRRNKPRARF